MTDIITADGEDDVVAAISAANDAHRAVEIIGGGSKRALGRPVEAEQRLDLGGVKGITLYEPAELVLRARAATPLAEIEDALAANRQTLAFEPPDLSRLLGAPAGRQTIGGIVATNLAGPRRCTAGAVRDHVLGLRAVNGRGEAFKAGGRVVKNVTGYDLCKLLTGSFGTLAVFTEITLKVLPAAETEETLVLAGLTAGQAVALMAEALGRPIGPSAAAWLPGPLAERTAAPVQGMSMTAFRLEGYGPSVAARLRQLTEMLDSQIETSTLDEPTSRQWWRQIRDVQPLTGGTQRAVWTISVPPSQAPGVLERLSRLAGAEAFLDWAGARIWLALPCGADAGAPVIRNALPADGHATLIAAPDDIRRRQPVFHPLPAAVARMEAALRSQFDPNAVLNPGRMAPLT